MKVSTEVFPEQLRPIHQFVFYTVSVSCPQSYKFSHCYIHRNQHLLLITTLFPQNKQSVLLSNGMGSNRAASTSLDG